MRVLGIDCGTECTGYGVVELCAAGRLMCLTCGAIKLSAREPLPRRLAEIFDRLEGIIEEHRPHHVAIEDVFYAVNAKSAIKLGQVRGVAMLAASLSGLDVAEYSPLSIKSAVVGYGKKLPILLNRKLQCHRSEFTSRAIPQLGHRLTG